MEMPKPDAALKDFFKDNEIFASVFNGYFYDNQDRIHYAMPIRKMLYDVLSFNSELAAMVETQDKVEWTVDERLSKVKKGTKITPIITVVFYTGEAPWDGPRTLHDMMDMGDMIKPFVPDYPLYVIDIGHDENLSFNNKSLEMLHSMLSSIYNKTGDNNTTEID